MPKKPAEPKFDVALWRAWGATWPLPEYRGKVTRRWSSYGVLIIGGDWQRVARKATLECWLPYSEKEHNGGLLLFPIRAFTLAAALCLMDWEDRFDFPRIIASKHAIDLLRAGPDDPRAQHELALIALGGKT